MRALSEQPNSVQVVMMHGQSPHNLDEQVVGSGQSYRWLKLGHIREKQEVQ
jgi:hypothetical protein